jgi:hypothetical protein
VPLTSEQIRQALEKNADLPTAMALSGALRDLLGAPAGGGYTEEMIEQIAELQVSLGIREDGVVGEHTRDALSAQSYLVGVDCASIWPEADSSPLARREHFLALYRRFDDRGPRGLPRVLGIRGAYPNARKTHRMIHARRYDDCFVLITDADAIVFNGSTHAYQRSFATASGAVASIRPGVYQMKIVPGSTPPKFNISTPDGGGNIPAFRDNDHDGVISEDEAARALAATGPGTKPGTGTSATEIQFHPGYETFAKPGKKFSSVGCQTAPLPELQLLERAGHEIDFVLANASDLARAATPLASSPNLA